MTKFSEKKIDTYRSFRKKKSINIEVLGGKIDKYRNYKKIIEIRIISKT